MRLLSIASISLGMIICTGAAYGTQIGSEPVVKMIVHVLGLFDLSGQSISTLSAGEETIVRTTIRNDIENEQAFVLFVEMRDGNDVTQSLSSHRGIAEGLRSESGSDAQTFETAWIPTEVCRDDDPECSNLYQIRSFAIIDSDNPEVLSPVFSISDIELVESQN